MDAEALVRALLQGDPEAWERFVDRTAGAVSAAVRSTVEAHRMRPVEKEIEDGVAAVYETLARQRCAPLAKLAPPFDLRGFAAWFAMRVTAEALRVRRDAARTLGVRDRQEPEPLPVDPGPQSLAGKVVDRLPPRDGMIVRLVYLHGLAYRETASLAGNPLNVIGPTLARSLRALHRSTPSSKEEVGGS